MRRILFPTIIALLLISGSSPVWSDVPQSVFVGRRQRLMEKVGEGICILTSAQVRNRNGDTNFDYRQDSNFYYLTGLEESNAICVLLLNAEKKYMLFVQPVNAMMKIWVEERAGVEGAMQIFGADTAFSTKEFSDIIKPYLAKHDPIYCTTTDMNFKKKLSRLIKEARGKKILTNPVPFLNEMRLRKDVAEIDILRKAARITAAAHIEAMRAVAPGLFEYEIEAIIEYTFRKNGATCPGFPSIVGSGPNSTVMHYTRCNRQTRDDDMILMDIGAELNMYTADVTRTIPVNGKFSPRQREIYEIVLQSQKEAIDLIKPGVGIYEVHSKSWEIVKDGLFRLGLITDKEADWQTRIYFMYNSNHWLGLDVHDVGSRGPDDGKGTILESGMVLTVEPGIYVGQSTLELAPYFAQNVPKEKVNQFIETVRPAVEKYMNIGVRIENDILVTQDGHENLSAKAPRDINEIEKLMAETSYLKKN